MQNRSLSSRFYALFLNDTTVSVGLAVQTACCASKPVAATADFQRERNGRQGPYYPARTVVGGPSTSDSPKQGATGITTVAPYITGLGRE